MTFDGTLVGVASGTTTAYVLATCDQVLAAAPGTYRDVFRFTGVFTGTVAGTPTSGELSYAGVTHPGGEIGATIRLEGGSSAVLRADARVAVGGRTQASRSRSRPHPEAAVADPEQVVR